MADKLLQKLAKQDATSPTPSAADNGLELVTNVEVERKIADFRAKHPKHVEYLKQLPRERLENIATLREIERQEQRERIREATVRKLEQWLKTRPEEAQRINEAVAKLPPENRVEARTRMIDNAIRNEAFRNSQGTNGQAVGGPKV
jgi:hypothetical protein